MDELLTAIANYGFPMVVTIYLLIRMESKIEKLEQAIIHLSKNIEKLTK